MDSKSALIIPEFMVESQYGLFFVCFVCLFVLVFVVLLEAKTYSGVKQTS